MFIRQTKFREYLNSKVRFSIFWVLASIILFPFNVNATFSTPGNFDVNPLGAATYSIPLKLPPGTANLTPSLSLQYNSQSDSGLSGRGWRIEGISQISRCPRTIAQDGVRGGINNDANDRYCLDGERLIAINGTYGGDGTEYRTEIASFAKIISYGSAGSGPAWFKVWTKKGQIIEYGNTSDSRIEVANNLTARVWAVNKVSDHFGNYYTASYTENNATGEAYITRLEYTGNSLAMTMPYAYVQFFYENRTDTSEFYRGGGLIKNQVRLSKITTNTDAENVKEYRIVYDNLGVNLASRLISITECDGEDNCLPSKLFTYSSNTDGAFQTMKAPTLVAAGAYATQWNDVINWGWQVKLGDVNGDGKTDVLALYQSGSTSNNGLRISAMLSNGDGTYSSSIPNTPVSTGTYLGNLWKYHIADVNGDGKDDVLLTYQATTANNGIRIQVMLSNGNGTFAPRVSSTPASTGAYDPGCWTLQMADVNGDGRSDVLALFRNAVDGCNNAHGIRTKVMFANANGTFTAPINTTPFTTDTYGSTGLVNAFPADVNGDGKSDIVATYEGIVNPSTSPRSYAVRAMLSNGDGTFSLPFNTLDPTTDYYYSSESQSADINGDGIADVIVRLSTNGNGVKTRVFLSKGNGLFTNGIGDTIYASGDFGAVGWKFHVADANGDGKQDLIGHYMSPSNTGIQVRIIPSIGDGRFSNPIVTTAASSGTYNALRWGSYVGDTNGDGKTDVIGIYQSDSTTNNGIRARLIESIPGVVDGIVSIKDGVTNAIDIGYQPITNNSIYTKDSGVNSAVYPHQDLQFPLWVVNVSTIKDKSWGNVSNNYSYGGAKADINGRGLLGFRWIKIKELESDLQTTTTYRQDYPWIGKFSQFQKHTIASGTLLRDIQNTYSTLTAEGQSAIAFPYVATTGENNYDLNGTSVSTINSINEYDTYGNLTQEVVHFGNGYNKTSNNIYLNDPSNWFIGRLLRTSITNETPVATSIVTSAFDYDLFSGVLFKEIVEPESTDLCVVEEYSFDAFGNRNTSTKRNCNGSAGSQPGVNTEAPAPIAGSEAIFESQINSRNYDPSGRFPTTLTNALNQVEERTYDSKFGGALLNIDINNLSTTRNYDGFGRSVNELRPDGTTTQWTYELHNLCIDDNCPTNLIYSIREIQSGKPDSRTYFDQKNRVTRNEIQDKDGTFIYSDNEYDNRGRVKRTSRPYYINSNIAWTNYTYDQLDRILTSANPDNTLTTFQYAGLVLTQINSLNQVRKETKDGLGKLIQVTDADNNNINYEYDPLDNLVKVTDSLNNVTTFNYDIRGRRINMNDPDQGSWSWKYDALGRIKKQIDAKLQEITYGYDKLNRITTRTEPDLVSGWDYDFCDINLNPGGKCKGKLVRETSNNGFARSFIYDSYSRATAELDNTDGTFGVSRLFDTLGRVASLVYPSGLTTNNIYSSTNYLVEVRNGTTNALYWKANTMDAEGRVINETLGNSTNVVRTYNPLNGQLTQIGAGLNYYLLNFNYVYDDLGNITQRNDGVTGLNESFDYDNQNRLINASANNGVSTTNVALTYDGIGNIVSKSDVGTYIYGVKPHAVAEIIKNDGITTYGIYSYDSNGNLLTGADRTTVWNSWNAPISITGTGINTPPSTLSSTYEFFYNSAHERVKEICPDGTIIYNLSPRVDTGIHVEKQIKPDGTISYIESLYAGKYPFGSVHRTIYPGGTVTVKTNYFHGDALGSIVAITDENAVLVDRRSYDAWGKRRNLDGTPLGNAFISPAERHGYTGHEELDNIGLIHMNGRVYDPAINRFMAADPIIQSPTNMQSYNAYSYVLNNPLRYTDPSGWMSEEILEEVNVRASRLPQQSISWGMGGGSINWSAGYNIIGPNNPYEDPSEGIDIYAREASLRLSSKTTSPVTNRNLNNIYGQGIQFQILREDTQFNQNPTGLGLEHVQNTLIGLSFVPGLSVATGLMGAGIDLYKGDYGFAILSIASAVPFIGEAGAFARASAVTVKSAGQIGRDGEAAVRSAYNIGDKVKLTINGRGRVPDGITLTTLSEVKNVERLSFTQQLRDYSSYAQRSKLEFNLYTRPDTQLSRPLRDAIESGFINHLYIP